MKRIVTALAGALALASCQDAPEPLAPDLQSRASSAVQGADRYVVVFKPETQDVATLANELAEAHGSRPAFVYEHALQGFAAMLPANAASALQRHPSVAYVEPDRVRHIFQTVPTGVQRIFADENSNLSIDGTDDYRVDVDVAIIDTGIDFEHPDLNVVGGTDCSGGGPFGGTCKDGGDDDHYHGTHVAGTVAALDNGIGVVGVAPGARLWAVKVLDQRGSGYTSWILAGIDWVAANASTIEVANMSLGGSGYSQSEYDAIQGAVDKGVAFAVAAGNSDDDASNYSPAAFDNVLTVSALADFDGQPGGLTSTGCRKDQDDTLADFSNWGSAVQIAAPGVCILSTYPIEQGEYGTISGTSMASPHAAGALALLASTNNPSNAADVHSLYDAVINAGNFDWEDDSGDNIHESLLDVSNTTLFAPTLVTGSESGGSTTDDPPSVSITDPLDGSTVSGAVSVTADATDDHGVTEVEFRVDGNSIGMDSDGSNGWSVSWNTADYADGTHTIEALATDNAGQTANSSIGVTVDNSTDSGGSVTVHVGDLDGSRKVKGKSGKWEAFVTVMVHDASDAAVANATVSVSWTGAATGSASATTGSDGTVSLGTGDLTSTSDIVFTVTNITGSSLTYDASQNHDEADEDGSNGTSITVTYN